MLVNTSRLLAAGKETIRLLLSRMVAYSGEESGFQESKFKPKYAAFFNSSQPQHPVVARNGSGPVQWENH
jgi:hypothetical protein